MKVLFVTPSFYPATYYGGPTFINRSYCHALAGKEGLRLTVLTTDADGPQRRIQVTPACRDEQRNYSVIYCRRRFRPDIAPGLLMWLLRMIGDADIVHLNGVYSFTTIPTIMLCRAMQKPIVWTTFGGLQRWSGTTRPRLKKLLEKICNLLSSPESVVLHLASEDEKVASVEAIPNASAFVLRNGVDVPTVDGSKRARVESPIRLLYIGRLHPIKGIENLFHALTRVKTDFRLSVCGEGDAAYSAHLYSLAQRLQLLDRVRFLGAVAGESKEQQFSQAHLCIAPSFKEAFCTVVLESLARAIPVIASTGTPWRGVEDVGCGLWVKNEPADLADAIDRAASMPLIEMGLLGRKWMQRDYSWSQVADETVDLYTSMIRKRNPNHEYGGAPERSRDALTNEP